MISWWIFFKQYNIVDSEVSLFCCPLLSFLESVNKSLRHLHQNSFVICCTRLHLCLQYKSGLWKIPGGGITTFDLVVNKLFGEKGLNPWPSLIVSTVSGRELITAMSVCKDSSSKLWPCVCNNDASIPLAERVLRSHIPLMWLAAGGFLFRFNQSTLLVSHSSSCDQSS